MANKSQFSSLVKKIVMAFLFRLKNSQRTDSAFRWHLEACHSWWIWNLATRRQRWQVKTPCLVGTKTLKQMWSYMS